MTLTDDVTVTSPWRHRAADWRKRLERQGLRWQARLEGLRFDRMAPWLIATVYWAVLAALALARSRELNQDESLAVPMQAVWLIGEGFKPIVSILGHNLLWEQASYLLYPVAWLTSFLPTAATLLVLQSGALAFGVVPLWRLARRVANLRVGTTAAVVLAYCLYSPVHAIDLAGFHPEALALPALLIAVLAGYEGYRFRYWASIIVVLLARADLGLVVAGMGVLTALEGRKRLGLATAITGFAYFWIMLLVGQPAYAGGQYPHLEAFAEYGDGNPLDVILGMIGHPVLVLEALFSAANFSTFVSLIAPVLFLPVVAPRYLLPAVPAYCVYLVAAVPVGQLVEAQQAIPVTAFVFVATVFALARTGRVLVHRVNVDRRIVTALVLTSIVFFIRDSPASLYEEPWSWGRQSETDVARHDAVDRIPEDAVVRASPKLLPLLTERPGLYRLDTAGPYADDVPDVAAAGVNYLVFDTTEAPEWEGIQFEQFELRLRSRLGWLKIFDENGIQVYRLPDAR